MPLRLLVPLLLAALVAAQDAAARLASPVARERLLALRSLREQPSAEGERLALQALRHPDPATRAMALTVLCELAPATGRRAAATACGEREPAMRAAALAALARLDGAKAIAAVQRGLSDPALTVRRSAAEALHNLVSTGAVKPTLAAPAAVRLVADAEPAVRLAGVALAKALPGEEGRAALLAACQGSDEDTAVAAGSALAGKPYAEQAVRQLVGRTRAGTAAERLLAAVALAATAHPAANAAVSGLAGPGQGLPDLRCAGLDILTACAAGLAPEARAEGERLAIASLAADDWAVRASAADALARLGSGRAVPALIAQLDATADPDAAALQQALVALSGETGIDTVAAWQAWWRRSQAGFAPRPPSPPDGSAEVAFYDIRDTADRVVFIIDTSISMAKGNDSTTLLGSARTELARCVHALPADSAFNVVFFNDQPRLWSPALRRATWRAKRDFSAVLTSLRPQGNTNTQAALALAWTQPEVEAIWLLSDGLPTIGVIDPTLIVQEVEAWRLQQPQPPRVHTVALLNRSAEGFLTLLARSCGGIFRHAP